MKTQTPSDTWATYRFPRWVPESVREELKRFWSEDFRRSPREWVESFKYAYSDHPALGEKVKCNGGKLWGEKRARTGRWVPMWNNIGRLVCRGGVVLVRSTGCIIKGQNYKRHESATFAALKGAR